MTSNNPFDWSIINDRTFLRSLGIVNEAARDDAIQDAALKLLQSPSITTALLTTATLNCYKDRVKADSRRTNRERRRPHYAREASCDSHDTDHDLPSVGPRGCPDTDNVALDDPSARLQRQERRRAIKRAVRNAKLPRNHRCALWASMRGRVAELARRWGVPEVTIRVWAKRARDALRPHLVRQGLGPDWNA